MTKPQLDSHLTQLPHSTGASIIETESNDVFQCIRKTMMSACRFGPFSENLYGFLQLLDGVIHVSIYAETMVRTMKS